MTPTDAMAAATTSAAAATATAATTSATTVAMAGSNFRIVSYNRCCAQVHRCSAFGELGACSKTKTFFQRLWVNDLKLSARHSLPGTQN